jgi:hypothetical protein
MGHIQTELSGIPIVATYYYISNHLEIGAVRIEGTGYSIKPILNATSLIKLLSLAKEKEAR